MKVLKDYHLDLTTAEPSRPSNCPTFREPKPSQKYQFRQKSPRKKKSPQKSPTKYTNSSFSSELGQLSLLSFPEGQSYDVCEHMESMQQKIFEQILSLRQQKLTLMQQHNLCTHERHRIQRQLAKYKKSNTTRQVTQTETLQLNKQKKQNFKTVTTEKINSNSNLNSNLIQSQVDYNYLSPNPEQLSPGQQQTWQRITNLRKYSQQLQKQLRQQEYGTHNQYTFRKQQAHQSPSKSSTKSSLSTPQNYIKSLKQKRQKLLQMIISHTQQQQLKQCLLTLIKSNQQLQSVVDWHFYHQKYILERLRATVREEQAKKKQFLQELIEFKSKIKHLRLQNQQLRKAIIYFRF